MYNVVHFHLFLVLSEYILVEVWIFVVQNHLYVVEKNAPIQIIKAVSIIPAGIKCEIAALASINNVYHWRGEVAGPKLHL
jgi:hypothetical protein